MVQEELIEKAKKHFLESFEKRKSSVYSYLPRHVAEAEKWAKKVLEKNPEADKNVVLLSVWLHDIGQLIKINNMSWDGKNDHAVLSEMETKRFLEELGLNSDLVAKVAHCVRAHRCKDVQPETLEAKLLAAVDSISHMTDICYMDMFSKFPKADIFAKIERDYRDAGLFPELQKEIKPLYEAWKQLLKVCPDK